MAGDPSCTTIREVLEEIEARIRASAIEIEIGNPLSGPGTMPNQRGSQALFVRREATRNLREQSRNQDSERVEDVVVVELQRRLSPKDQITTRGDFYDLIDDVRELLTVLSWRRQWNVVHTDTLERMPTGEYLTVQLRFSIKRYQTLGG